MRHYVTTGVTYGWSAGLCQARIFIDSGLRALLLSSTWPGRLAYHFDTWAGGANVADKPSLQPPSVANSRKTSAPLDASASETLHDGPAIIPVMCVTSFLQRPTGQTTRRDFREKLDTLKSRLPADIQGARSESRWWWRRTPWAHGRH